MESFQVNKTKDNFKSKKYYIMYSIFFLILQMIIILTLFILYKKEPTTVYTIRTLEKIEEDECDSEEYFYSRETGRCFKNKEIKVLLITDKKATDLIYNLLNTLPYITKITIDNPYNIPQYTLGFLSMFDCVLYDTFEGSLNVDVENRDIIETFIKNGGAFLVTHDRWDEDNGPLVLIDCEKDRTRNYSELLSRKAKVSEFGHPIFNSYYDLKDWTVIDIAESHKSYHKIIDRDTNTAKIVMEFVIEKERGIKYDYLIANEIGEGRIIYWAAGHTQPISSDEQKLFFNILAWLAKIEEK